MTVSGWLVWFFSICLFNMQINYIYFSSFFFSLVFVKRATTVYFADLLRSTFNFLFTVFFFTANKKKLWVCGCSARVQYFTEFYLILYSFLEFLWSLFWKLFFYYYYILICLRRNLFSTRFTSLGYSYVRYVVCRLWTTQLNERKTNQKIFFRE